MVIGTDTNRSATYDFLLTFHSKNCPISYRFRDKRRFQSKIAIFPTLVYLTYPMEFPVELGIIVRGQKTRMVGLSSATGLRKKFDDIFTIYERDGRTDGHRMTAKTALTHSVAR